jgi:Holliday junction resolvase RusA-like endonuclease
VSTYATVGFWINEKPAPKQRPRVTRNGTYTPKQTVQAEAAVRAAWRESGSEQIPTGLPIQAEFTFYLERPKAHYRASGELNTAGLACPWPIVSGRKNADIDNYVKLVLDALNGCAFVDDAAIVSVHADKKWDENPRSFVCFSARIPDARGATR